MPYHKTTHAPDRKHTRHTKTTHEYTLHVEHTHMTYMVQSRHIYHAYSTQKDTNTNYKPPTHHKHTRLTTKVRYIANTTHVPSIENRIMHSTTTTPILYHTPPHMYPSKHLPGVTHAWWLTA